MAKVFRNFYSLRSNFFVDMSWSIIHAELSLSGTTIALAITQSSANPLAPSKMNCLCYYFLLLVNNVLLVLVSDRHRHHSNAFSGVMFRYPCFISSLYASKELLPLSFFLCGAKHFQGKLN